MKNNQNYRITLKSKEDGKLLTIYNNIFDLQNGIAFFEIDRFKWELISADKYSGLEDKDGESLYENDLRYYKGRLSKVVYDGWQFRFEQTMREHGQNWEVVIGEDEAYESSLFN